MTDREELIYLTELLLSSQNWTRSENDDVPVILEIRDRISKLVSVPTDRLVGPGDPDGTCPDKYERQRKYVEGKVRVSWTDADGKNHRTWFDKDLCKQIPIAAGCCTKLKWVLKDQEELGKLKEMAEEE